MQVQRLEARFTSVFLRAAAEVDIERFPVAMTLLQRRILQYAYA
jgi:hypothetical protein